MLIKRITLKTSKLTSEILALVENETDVKRSDILSSLRTTEVVDARHITIMLLYRAGVYPSKIADIFKITPRGVQYIIADFDTRILVNPIVRQDYERITKKLGTNLELIAK